MAIIDLGTNTFQLIVAKETKPGFEILLQKSTPSRLGKGGINQGIITPEAMARALLVLEDFKKELDAFGLSRQQILAFGTSAIRNAANKAEFLDAIRAGPGLPVRIIDGETEAHLIYLGVREAVSLGTVPNLIMDIGGGSVEFVIADGQSVYWKRSFETGGQRLLDRFVKSDPLSSGSIRKINDFLEERLIDLSNAVHQYAPKILVGSSGTFETLAEIDHWNRMNEWPPAGQNGFDIPLEEFYRSRNLILSATREERMKIPGMRELRVDMIPVAICLIDYIISRYHISTVKASRYSLKEGALVDLLQTDNRSGFPSY